MKNGMRLSKWIVWCGPDNMLLKSGLHLTLVKLPGPAHLGSAVWGESTPCLDTNNLYWFQMSLKQLGEWMSS